MGVGLFPAIRNKCSTDLQIIYNYFRTESLVQGSVFFWDAYLFEDTLYTGISFADPGWGGIKALQKPLLRRFFLCPAIRSDESGNVFMCDEID
jgi:hypothetical protein